MNMIVLHEFSGGVARFVTAFSITLAMLSGTGCAKATTAPVPSLPPSYYACTESTPIDLMNAYYSHYFAIAGAEIVLKDKVFVFKNIAVTAAMEQHATDEYVWINEGSIKCYFVSPGERARLRAGQSVDVVGVNEGMCPDYAGTLFMKDCFFLPAGAINLPAVGGATLWPSY
jgi:hypothetical protein